MIGPSTVRAVQVSAAQGTNPGFKTLSSPVISAKQTEVKANKKSGVKCPKAKAIQVPPAVKSSNKLLQEGKGLAGSFTLLAEVIRA